MKDVKYKFSKDDRDYVAASPFMQLMLELSVAAPGTTIVVQFSSGVGMHVDYRHMHGSAADVRAPHPHPVLQQAPPARSSMHVPLPSSAGSQAAPCAL